MRARWLFRIVERDFTSHYLKVEGKLIMHVGSETEALAIIKRLTIATPNALRVEAVSLGIAEGISELDGCAQVYVQPDRHGYGWCLDGDMMHGSCHTTIEEAINYAATRTYGCVSQTSVLDRDGKLKRLVLIDGSITDAESAPQEPPVVFFPDLPEDSAPALGVTERDLQSAHELTT